MKSKTGSRRYVASDVASGDDIVADNTATTRQRPIQGATILAHPCTGVSCSTN
jgi:hypothetical protein